MNMIFSIFLCLTMLFSGTSLPDTPQTAAVTTISDISLCVDGESVTLAPQLSFTAAAGMQELAGRFEASLDGDTLLPLTGAITPDALAFSLTDASHYISIPASAMNAAMSGMGFTQEDAAMMENLPAALKACEAILTAYAQDPMLKYEDASRMAELFVRECGVTPTDIQVEIDGEMYDAVEYNLNTATWRDIYRCYDAMLTCGDERLEAIYAAMLEIYRMDGRKYVDFSAATRNTENIDNRVFQRYTFASGEDWHCVGSGTFTNDGNGAYQNISYTALIRQDSVGIDMYGCSDNQDGRYNIGVNGTLSGEASLAEAADLHFSFSAVSRKAQEEGEPGAFYPFAVSGSLNKDAAGWSLDVECGESKSEMNWHFIAEIAGEPQADGGAAYAWRISMPERRSELSFDVKKSSQPYASFFEGRQAREHDLSETSAAGTQLSIDALALTGDVTVLSADESVQRFGELFRKLQNFTPVVDLSAANGYNDYAEDYENDENDKYDKYDENSNAQVFSTIGEARAHYDGVIPDLTLPEEFELDQLCINSGAGNDVELRYSCGEEQIYIWLSGSEQPQPSSEAYYRVAGNGSLRRMRDTIVRIREYSFGGVSASISSRDFNCAMAFYNIDDMERIQAIIAGLCP